jgi:hypothetical protein
MADPEKGKGGRGKTSRFSERLSGHERNLLSQARTVLAVLPEVAGGR